jgi:hypothetical protein
VDQLRLQLLQACFGLLALGQIADKTGEISLVTRFHFADCKLHGES